MSYELIALLMFASMALLLVTGQRVFAAIGFVAAGAALLLYGNGAIELPYNQVFKPVSYTHLDVYKRQAPHRRPCPPFQPGQAAHGKRAGHRRLNLAPGDQFTMADDAAMARALPVARPVDRDVGHHRPDRICLLYTSRCV